MFILFWKLVLSIKVKYWNNLNKIIANTPSKYLQKQSPKLLTISVPFFHQSFQLPIFGSKSSQRGPWLPVAGPRLLPRDPAEELGYKPKDFHGFSVFVGDIPPKTLAFLRACCGFVGGCARDTFWNPMRCIVKHHSIWYEVCRKMGRPQSGMFGVWGEWWYSMGYPDFDTGPN